MGKNKKGLINFGTIAGLIIILLLVYACCDYYLETKGQNKEKAEFCEDLGYSVNNEVSFFYEITCYKIEDGIKEDYAVRKSSTKIGENYDEEYEYYLKKIVRIR